MMSELMKRLQQWADEGAYQFPCEESPNGDINVNGGGWAMLYDLQSSFSSFGCLFNYVYRVLDGTIPVWRPVEHYPITEEYENCLGLLKDGTRVHINVNCGFINAKSLEIDLDDENYDGDTSVDFDNVTHWQPLPQLIQEGKETNNV